MRARILVTIIIIYNLNAYNAPARRDINLKDN